MKHWKVVLDVTGVGDYTFSNLEADTEGDAIHKGKDTLREMLGLDLRHPIKIWSIEEITELGKPWNGKIDPCEGCE